MDGLLSTGPTLSSFITWPWFWQTTPWADRRCWGLGIIKFDRTPLPATVYCTVARRDPFYWQPIITQPIQSLLDGDGNICVYIGAGVWQLSHCCVLVEWKALCSEKLERQQLIQAGSVLMLLPFLLCWVLHSTRTKPMGEPPHTTYIALPKRFNMHWWRSSLFLRLFHATITTRLGEPVQVSLLS